MQTHVVKAKKLHKSAVLPKQATEDSAGLDLYACFGDRKEIKIEDGLTKTSVFLKASDTGRMSFVLPPGKWAAIPTGFAVALPRGVYGCVASRSGMAKKKGLIVHQGTGTVDPDYRGEIYMIIRNVSEMDQIIYDGDRLAQLIPIIYKHIELELSKDLEDTDRGSGGFGSTGHN